MNCKVCQNLSPKNPSLSFFRFPSDYNRCRDWAKRCGILPTFKKYGPGKFYKSFRICSNHFESKYIVFDGKKKKLLSCAVPKEFHGKSLAGITCYSKDLNSQSESDVGFIFKLMENLCRFCAEEDAQLIDIYSSKGKMLELEEKIKLFPITINIHDKLPLKVCSQCIIKISKFYDFVKNCVRADIRLKTILGLNEHVESGNGSGRPDELKLQDFKRTDNENSASYHNSKTVSTMVENTEKDLNNLNVSVDECRKLVHLENNFSFFLDNVPHQHNPCQIQDINDKFECNEGKKISMSNSAEVKFSTTQEAYSYKESIKDTLPENSAKIFDQKYENLIKNKYTCNKCFKNFGNLEILESHKKAHSLEPDEHGRFICQTCGKEFRNKYRLNEHNRVHTGEYPFKCTACNKKFHKMALLRQHSLVHESRKRFVCSICRLRSGRKGNLIQHLRTHYKIVKCENSKVEANNLECSGILGDMTDHEKSSLLTKSWINKNVLLEEYPLLNSSEKKDISCLIFSCRLCQMEFFDHESLENHFKIHTNKNLKSCHDQMQQIGKDNSDQKTSESKESINIIRLRETNERNYRCEECGGNFKRKDTLKNHSRIHTGERPFVCKTCGFAFKQRGDCLKHERNHKKGNDEQILKEEFRNV